MTSQRISIAANPRIPAPVNEPPREFRPGSAEAESVLREIERLNGEVREITHIVNGERIGSAQTLNVVAPHDHRHVYATIPATDPAIIDRAIHTALEAQYEWSRTPWWERAAIFQRVGELAAGKYRDELVATTMVGQSKTFHQAEIDAACEVTDFMRFNTALAAEIYSDQPPSLTGDINTIDQRPLEGFVLALTPFNFTAIAANLPTTPALMGNTVVWKTSEKSALSSEVLYRVFEEAGLPPGVINLVHGSGRVIAERALSHPDFAGLTFTGSTEVFRDLWKKAAQNIDTYKSFPRLVGETGGKNAVVAHPSADPDAVRTALIRAAFEYQGQKCSAASRAYIARSIWEIIKEELVETVRSLPIGDPTNHETFIGAVIDEAAMNRLEDVFRRAAELESHKLLVGGRVHGETGWFVEPTIYESSDPTAFTFTEEFFGPLLVVYVFEDNQFEAMLPLVDSVSEYALTLSIFSSNRAAISYALDALRNTAGMTYINDKPTGALMGQVSFGGGRASGTNDKTGSRLALQRWVNGRFIKESLNPAREWAYPYLRY